MRFAVALAFAHEAGVTRREQLAAVETSGAVTFREAAGAWNPWCYLQSAVPLPGASEGAGEPLVQVAVQVTNCAQCHTKELTHIGEKFKGYHISTYLNAQAAGGKCECFLGHEQHVLSYIRPVGTECGSEQCWRKYIAETDALTLGLPSGQHSQITKQDLKTGAHSHAGAWQAQCDHVGRSPDWFYGYANEALDAPRVLLRPVQDSQRNPAWLPRAALQGNVDIQVEWGSFDFDLPGLEQVPAGSGATGPFPVKAKQCFLNGVAQPTPWHCEAKQLLPPVLCCQATESPVEAGSYVLTSDTRSDASTDAAERVYTRSQQQTLTLQCRVVTADPAGSTTSAEGWGDDVCEGAFSTFGFA